MYNTYVSVVRGAAVLGVGISPTLHAERHRSYKRAVA